MRLSSTSATSIVAGAALILVLVPGVLAASPTIGITDKGFDPTSTTIAAGDAVTWQNRGLKPHTVTADDGSFDSGVLDPGNQFANVFDHAGRFSYHSSGDPTFHGTVIVKAAPITPTPATFVPTPPPGTLPPGFSPHPRLTEPPPPTPAPTAAPTPTPTADGTNASGASGLALPFIAGSAIVLLAGLWRLRATRQRPGNRSERRRRN